MRHGTSVEQEYGPEGAEIIYPRNSVMFKKLNVSDPIQMAPVLRWRQGRTGMPLVDALMRSMNRTGWMPERGRMIVASYLALDLQIDWRLGASYFEEMLIDYDYSSNYGGWCYCVGLGTIKVHKLNVILQSRKFDEAGEYVRKWVPELRACPDYIIHDPWNLEEKD